MLAQVLARSSNLLVLDEPTNDLDMETLEVLEEMLGEYAGTILLISHDRDFLDRIVNGVIAPEGEGLWIEYGGGYSDMLAQRGADLTRKRRDAEPQKPATRIPREAAASAAPSQPARRRMGFKEKHALETLPNTIAALQAEARSLQAKLDDPQFYARDRAAFEKVSLALGELQQKIRAAEDEWLELEIVREELASGG
jgi:ATP-binding cassette subfamily F protein uup